MAGTGDVGSLVGGPVPCIEQLDTPPDAVETPVNLTKRQQELLRQFEDEAAKGDAKSSPESEGFFAKVASFFEGRG